MATVTVIDKRSGELRVVDERGARILVALGKAIFSNEPERTLEQEYMTRSMQAAPAMVRVKRQRYESIEDFVGRADRELDAVATKRRGRPPGSKNREQ